MPTQIELKEDLDNLVFRKKALDKHFEAIEHAFSTVVGSPFYDSVYFVFEDYTKELCRKHQLEDEDMSWFIYDLDCGNDPETLQVTIDGIDQSFTINDADSFILYLKAHE
jgi:hypothetical protein